jgi:hypothetical protein
VKLAMFPRNPVPPSSEHTLLADEVVVPFTSSVASSSTMWHYNPEEYII